MKKLLTEFIGTFFLVFTVGMTVIAPGAGALAPLAIGLSLMVMVYAGGHVSGGYYNPAITIGVWLRKKLKGKEVLGYIVAQILGSMAASALVLCLKGNPIEPMTHFEIIPALIAEIVGTFALVYVVLNTATAKATAGNSHYGLAIGLTVTAMAFAVGPLSGGAFNPAVALGISSMSLVAWGNFWVYLLGDFFGAWLAAVAFRAINPGDK